MDGISNKLERWLELGAVKRLLASLLIGVAMTGFVSEYGQTVQADIAKNVVRLHVLANSDSEADQALKLQVRDAVIAYLQQPLEGATSVEQTKEIIAQHIPQIEEVARQTLAQNGCDMPVRGMLGNFEFPTKEYGDCRLPAGQYDALRILIGEAKGQNWWCVLYPQLCFIKNKEGKLPPKSRNQLKNVLTEDEFKVVTAPKTAQTYQIKFKIVEWFSQKS